MTDCQKAALSAMQKFCAGHGVSNKEIQMRGSEYFVVINGKTASIGWRDE